MILRRTVLATATAAAVTAMIRPASAHPRTAEATRSAAALRTRPASEQLAALRARQVTSRELLEQHLEHIAKMNPQLNAVVTLDAEGARAAADKADSHLATTGTPLGALHGLPMTVKDALEVEGMRTTCGSPTLSDHVPDRDADVIALLRDAGAIIVGHTNVPTMCQDIQTSNPIFGTTPNPFDATKTAGGSSGGPAAAVAAGFTSLEIGSDLAGSLRLPAAYCGVYALRTSRGTSPVVPTRGHIPRLPGWTTSSDMITLGPIARTVEDLDLLLDVITAPSPADRAGWKIDLPAPTKTKLAHYRVGVWSDDPYCRVDADTRALLDQVADLVRGLGATVDDSTRPVDFTDSDNLFQRLMYATASATATDEDFATDIAAAEKIPADDPTGLYLHSRTMRHRDWCVADEARQELRATWDTYFARHDVLITPAVPTAAVPDQTNTPAPQRYITVDGQKRSFYDQTSWLNLTSAVGLPSLVLPAGTTSAGLPLSLQIIGPYLGDRTVLEVARQLARKLPQPVRPPAFAN
ncbi:amidase family protein [Streptomyces sp. NPDC088768]|uniref:amidase family protein n=1 Tax=Streptomyces sp. NPDC088768 TaxID=3365894 RepID=UPI0038026B35